MDCSQLSFLEEPSAHRPAVSARERAERVLRGFADLNSIGLVKPRSLIHFDHEVHSNSLASLREDASRLSVRREEVFSVFEMYERPLTDREVLELTAYTEVNCVQPRITELVKAGRLFEFGKKRCRWTGKRVRVCAVSLNRSGRETKVFRAWKTVLGIEGRDQA